MTVPAFDMLITISTRSQTPDTILIVYYYCLMDVRKLSVLLATSAVYDYPSMQRKGGSRLTLISIQSDRMSKDARELHTTNIIRASNNTIAHTKRNGTTRNRNVELYNVILQNTLHNLPVR